MARYAIVHFFTTDNPVNAIDLSGDVMDFIDDYRRDHPGAITTDDSHFLMDRLPDGIDVESFAIMDRDLFNRRDAYMNAGFNTAPLPEGMPEV